MKMYAKFCVNPFGVPIQQLQNPALTSEDGCIIGYRTRMFKSYQDGFCDSLYSMEYKMMDLKLLMYNNLSKLI